MKIEDTRLSAPWERGTFGSSLVLFLKHRFQSLGQRTNSPQRAAHILRYRHCDWAGGVLNTFIIDQSVTL